MGKKSKSKKGKGAEKTTKKTQQNLEKRLKKVEMESGEQSIEQLIDEFRQEQQKLTTVTCVPSAAPSPRSHFTLTAAVDSDELILFGGEFFDGNKITMFADLFIYGCKEKSWTIVQSPNSPPPRSGHQAVYGKSSAIPASVWIFGGEYASPTQTRFYHYRDLWCLRTRTRKWECLRIDGNHGPCARSGHRMIFSRNSIFLFGGFSDTGRKTIYFNDLWQFVIDSKNWSQIKLSGEIPVPRSACLFFPGSDQKSLFILGGYHKEYVGKDLEKGVVCSDFFRVTLDKNNDVAISVSVRTSGMRPKPPHSAMAGVLQANNHALVFGGVHDVESDDGETVTGYFHNDLYAIELDKAKWHLFNYATEKRIRGADGNATATEITPNIDKPAVPVEGATCISDAVFTLTLKEGPETQSQTQGNLMSSAKTASLPAIPSPRASPGMALLGSNLYIYGGVFEAGDRKVTLDDFYCLDLSHPTSWECLYTGTGDKQEWFGSDAEDDDEDEEEGESDEEEENTQERVRHTQGDVEMDEDGDSSSEDDDELVVDAPVPEPGENYTAYWTRTTFFWCTLVSKGLEDDSGRSSSFGSAIIGLAERYAKDFFENSARRAN